MKDDDDDDDWTLIYLSVGNALALAPGIRTWNFAKRHE